MVVRKVLGAARTGSLVARRTNLRWRRGSDSMIDCCSKGLRRRGLRPGPAWELVVAVVAVAVLISFLPASRIFAMKASAS